MQTNSHINDEISFFSCKKELLGYRWETLRRDLGAGFAVALLTLPQAMGYSLLAGLPLFCGLFAAIYASSIAALFGSSRHLIVGPSNAIAVLVQTGTSEIIFTYYRDLTGSERDYVALQILTQLSLLMGLFQMLVAGFKLGRLMQFVSYSVITGYITGTAIALIINQLYPFLGIERQPGVHSFYERGAYLVMHLNEAYWPTLCIGLGSLIVIILLRKVNKRIPAGLIAFAVTGLIVYFFGLNEYDQNAITSALSDEKLLKVAVVGDTELVSNLIPKFEWPLFDLTIMSATIPIACALGLVSIMESTSVAKSIASSSGQRLSVNQEVFGISLGNIFSAFIGSLPLSGNPSRSSLNYNYGAQTRFASISSACMVAMILYSLGTLVSLIPLAALAALLLHTSCSAINTKQFFMCAKSTGSDAFVLWLTMLSCIFFSLDVAFYIGVALSITLYLKKAALPQLKEYDVDENGVLQHFSVASPHEVHREIRVIKIEGELFFGAADLFQTTLKAIAEDDTSTRIIILHLKNARDIDATTCLALQQLYDYLKNSGRYLIACGLTWQIWEVLSDSGIVELIGKENLFVFDEHHPQEFMVKAYARAKELNRTGSHIEKSDELEEIHEIGEDMSLKPAETSN